MTVQNENFTEDRNRISWTFHVLDLARELDKLGRKLLFLNGLSWRARVLIYLRIARSLSDFYL